MNYMEVFEDVVSIVNTDYAGFKDKAGWGKPEGYRESIQKQISENTITPSSFESIVSDFILDYKDAHMFFMLSENMRSKATDIGFTVRRFEDKLYVTSVTNEKRLKAGDAIIALDGISIPDAAETHKKKIQCKGPGYEREVWRNVLSKYSSCSVLSENGNIYDMELEQYDPIPYTPDYSLKVLEDEIILITLSDFFNDDPIHKLITDNSDAIKKCKGLVVDVRNNRGGSDSAYYKLLDYIFDKEIDLNTIEGGMQFNMTERNYGLRMNQLKSYLEKVNDQTSKNFMVALIKKLEQYKDQGLVEVDLLDLMPDMIIKGSAKPEKVVVLTDVYCGSSGDAFVYIAGMSDKVKIMGRPTAGVTDYSNLAIQTYGNEFVFMYPTSRENKIDQGKGISGKGHQPDIYIPWTPEHIKVDVDLNFALEWIKK